MIFMTELDFMASTILKMNEDELKAFSMSMNTYEPKSKKHSRKEHKNHD